MNTKPAVLFLSSSRILEEYYLKQNNFYDQPDKIDLLKSILFLDFHAQNSGMPDYVYKKLLANFMNPTDCIRSANVENSHASNCKIFDSAEVSLQSLLIKAFKIISEKYLYFRDNQAFINTEKFEDWQNTVTCIPPLPILSFAIYNKCKESFRFNTLEFTKEVFKASTLPSVFDPELEDFFCREGLRDIHIHLTGTTEADYVWQDALRYPKEFFKNINSALKGDNKFNILEQYLQISNLTPEDIYRLLVKAGRIRDELISILRYFETHSPDSETLYYQQLGAEMQCGLSTANIPFRSIFGREITCDEPFIIPYNIHPWRSLHESYPSIFDPSAYLSSFNSDGSMPSTSEEINSIQYEALFLIDAFGYLETNNDKIFATYLHYYLLIYSFFNKMLVQQISQVGFDQFQKITINELRAQSEKAYERRYNQLKGMYNDDLIYLEGRFSPKDDSAKTYSLLRSIIESYEKKIKNKERNKEGNEGNEGNEGIEGKDKADSTHPDFDLSLVCHFIKSKDNRFRNSESLAGISNLGIRDAKLRLKISENIKALLSVTRLFKKYKDYISGFDAAANELDASPEVFAPGFRYLRFLGFNHFTYHAGEDFIHLISGIRAVYEAVTFLELSQGDRIGHATALGIDPKLWLNKIGDKIVMERGEWFDNLIFAYHIISEHGIDFNLEFLKEQIRKYFWEIYYEKNCEIFDMIEAWRLRKLDPLKSFEIYYETDWSDNDRYETGKHSKDGYLCQKFSRQDWSCEEFKNIEVKKIKDSKKQNTKAFKLFHRYHDSDVIMKCKELIEINLSGRLFPPALYLELQKKVIEYMNKKTIAIESMPTSNLRISFYDSYSEHHIFRWLNVDSSALPKPIICLGSDDPGIFAVNIRNEFSHVFTELLKKDKTRKEAMDIIKEIADNNRIFSFKRYAGARGNADSFRQS